MKTIGVLTPSGAVDEQNLIQGIKYWESKGFAVKQAEHLYDQNRFCAGTDESRVADLHEFFRDDGIDMIFAAGGGYGSARILNKIDYELIAKHKKPFVGLSDTTALQLAFFKKAGLVSFSGYVMKPRNGRVLFPYTEQSLSDCLEQKDQIFSGLESNDDNHEISGQLIGGCLSLVDSLLGTPFFPNPENKILILEDLNEEPYIVDRMLTHLENAEIFDKVNAVVFGVFLNCKAKDPADGTIQDVLDEWKKRIKKPVFSGFPYGHQAGSAVWPIGANAVLKNKTMSVSKVIFNG